MKGEFCTYDVKIEYCTVKAAKELNPMRLVLENKVKDFDAPGVPFSNQKFENESIKMPIKTPVFS